MSDRTATATIIGTDRTYQWPTRSALERWMTGDTTITPQPVTPQPINGMVRYVPCPDTPPPADTERGATWHIIPTMSGGYIDSDSDGYIRHIRPGPNGKPITRLRVSLEVRLENDSHVRLPYDTFGSALYRAQEVVATRALLTDTKPDYFPNRLWFLCEKRHGWWGVTAFLAHKDELCMGDGMHESVWWDPEGDWPVEAETVALLVEAVNARPPGWSGVEYVVVS